MSNYAATVFQIDNLRHHMDAQKLICSTIFGNNVIVSINTQIGDVGLYFVPECQLSEDFCTANDLIRRKDSEGKSAGGMLDVNRRIRTLKLRGEKSMGFWIPISSLNKTFESLNKLIPEVQVGDEFEELNGVPICCKYIVPVKWKQANPSAKKGKKPVESRLIDGQFTHHFDTAQLAKNIFKIKKDSLISVTWKMHGSSGITGRVLVKKPLKLYEKILKKIGVNIIDSEYDYIYSSRRVIKNGKMITGPGFYGEDLWTHSGEQFKGKLHKGENIFYEICGFTPGGRPIQKNFDYSCKQCEYKIYIYRITQINIDGVVTELPWHQVKHRALELGQETVPEIYYGKANDWFDEICAWSEDRWKDEFFNKLRETYVCDQDSQFCRSIVPEEGVVVRLELGDGIENLKLKSFRFLLAESNQLDSGECDMESEESFEEAT